MDPLRGLMPGEKMMTCPYDKSHQVSERRFFHHFYKCRRNYSASKALKGEKVYELNCKHNHHHKVPEVEIAFHESTCEDGKKLRPHLLRGAVKTFFPGLYEQFKKYAPFEEEKKRMYDGLKPGMVFSHELLGQPISIEDVIEMSPEDLRLRRNEILIKVMTKEWLLRCGRISQEEYDERAAKEEMEKMVKAAKADDDDDWSTDADGPGFDFWKNIWDPNVRHASVPNCLSKVERKLFMKIHAKRWEKERLEKLELQRELERNPLPGTYEHWAMQRLQWNDEIADTQNRNPPVRSRPAPTTNIIKSDWSRERDEMRVRFNMRTEVIEDEDQLEGAVGGTMEARALRTPSPPPLQPPMSLEQVTQKWWGHGGPFGAGALGTPFRDPQASKPLVLETQRVDLGGSFGTLGTPFRDPQVPKPLVLETQRVDLGGSFGTLGTPFRDPQAPKPLVVETQRVGLRGSFALRASGTPLVTSQPPKPSVLETQKVAVDKVEEFADQSARAAGALVVRNRSIADDIRNYQFDDEDWMQPGLVMRSQDPYWGTGNKDDEYELTVKRVGRK